MKSKRQARSKRPTLLRGEEIVIDLGARESPGFDRDRFRYTLRVQDARMGNLLLKAWSRAAGGKVGPVTVAHGAFEILATKVSR